MSKTPFPELPLPADPSPPLTVCVQLTMPADAEYWEEFYGQLLWLTHWFAYERDDAHAGLQVAATWRRIIDTIRFCSPPPPSLAGLLEDFDMPLRVDCNCNVFVTCCDGTEKQILTADQVQALLQGQPGGGSGSPTPGGCKTYPFVLTAGGAYFVPPIVNAGDTLTLNNLDGATTDVSPIGRWNCPTGLQFFASTCTGDLFFLTGSLAPALPVGIPLYNIGGVYYDARVPLTVPGGIVNQVAGIVMNYPTGGSYAGSITGELAVCNNAVAAWELSQNLATVDGGWTPTIATLSGTQTIWSAGAGWQSVACNNMLGGTGRYNIVFVKLVFDHPTTLEHVDILYNSVVGDLADGGGDKLYKIVGGLFTAISSVASASGTGKTLVFDGSIPSCEGIVAVLYGSDHNDSTCPPTGSALLRAANLHGSGVAPF